MAARISPILRSICKRILGFRADKQLPVLYRMYLNWLSKGKMPMALLLMVQIEIKAKLTSGNVEQQLIQTLVFKEEKKTLSSQALSLMKAFQRNLIGSSLYSIILVVSKHSPRTSAIRLTTITCPQQFSIHWCLVSIRRKSVIMSENLSQSCNLQPLKLL